MWLARQATRISIENLDYIWGGGGGTIFRKRGRLSPDSFRAIFCGSSGCGNTKCSTIYAVQCERTKILKPLRLVKVSVPTQMSVNIRCFDEMLKTYHISFDNVACDKRDRI